MNTLDKTQLRWMIRCDMEEVLEIESHSFDDPWDRESLILCLRERNVVSCVVELDGCVVGFMIYELHKTRIHIVKFAVHQHHRRKGIGSLMADKLIGKLSPWRRNQIILEVDERNLSAQKFFRSRLFAATKLLRNFYENEQQSDAYRMVYETLGDVIFPEKDKANLNRISRYY